MKKTLNYFPLSIILPLFLNFIETFFEITEEKCFLLYFIFRKFLNSDISTSIDVNMYIRYILAYKLWKKIMKTIDERKQITKIAVGKLFWPPNLQRSANVFGSVLPKIPKSKKDPTLFFIQAKFKIKSAYEVKFHYIDRFLRSSYYY